MAEAEPSSARALDALGPALDDDDPADRAVAVAAHRRAESRDGDRQVAEAVVAEATGGERGAEVGSAPGVADQVCERHQLVSSDPQASAAAIQNPDRRGFATVGHSDIVEPIAIEIADAKAAAQTGSPCVVGLPFEAGSVRRESPTSGGAETPRASVESCYRPSVPVRVIPGSLVGSSDDEIRIAVAVEVRMRLGGCRRRERREGHRGCEDACAESWASSKCDPITEA